ncbi:MAG TPA: hypothetical protein VII47_06150 [Actinomycetota bacterium]
MLGRRVDGPAAGGWEGRPPVQLTSVNVSMLINAIERRANNVEPLPATDDIHPDYAN